MGRKRWAAGRKRRLSGSATAGAEREASGLIEGEIPVGLFLPHVGINDCRERGEKGIVWKSTESTTRFKERAPLM